MKSSLEKVSLENKALEDACSKHCRDIEKHYEQFAQLQSKMDERELECTELTEQLSAERERYLVDVSGIRIYIQRT